MKLVITMAGKGSRFRAVGIDTPKHRISIDGRSMFEYAMSSLRDFFDEDFVFVCLDAYDDRPFLTEKCSSLGIENFDIVELSEVTDGQATTVREAAPYVDADEAVAVYNIDTYIEEGALRKADVRGDGWIPVFRAPGERWSFVATDEAKATDVAEKERISELATVGLYYFDRWADYDAAYRAEADTVADRYGEKYIAPLYGWLIDEGYDVYTTEVSPEDVHVLGTPEDLTEFYPPFKQRYED